MGTSCAARRSRGARLPCSASAIRSRDCAATIDRPVSGFAGHGDDCAHLTVIWVALDDRSRLAGARVDHGPRSRRDPRHRRHGARTAAPGRSRRGGLARFAKHAAPRAGAGVADHHVRCRVRPALPLGRCRRLRCLADPGAAHRGATAGLPSAALHADVHTDRYRRRSGLRPARPGRHDGRGAHRSGAGRGDGPTEPRPPAARTGDQRRIRGDPCGPSLRLVTAHRHRISDLLWLLRGLRRPGAARPAQAAGCDNRRDVRVPQLPP